LVRKPEGMRLRGGPVSGQEDDIKFGLEGNVCILFISESLVGTSNGRMEHGNDCHVSLQYPSKPSNCDLQKMDLGHWEFVNFAAALPHPFQNWRRSSDLAFCEETLVG
jgi:hypothetical protein